MKYFKSIRVLIILSSFLFILILIYQLKKTKKYFKNPKDYSLNRSNTLHGQIFLEKSQEINLFQEYLKHKSSIIDLIEYSKAKFDSNRRYLKKQEADFYLIVEYTDFYLKSKYCHMTMSDTAIFLICFN